MVTSFDYGNLWAGVAADFDYVALQSLIENFKQEQTADQFFCNGLTLFTEVLFPRVQVYKLTTESPVW